MLFVAVCIIVTVRIISRLPLAVHSFRAALLHVSYKAHVTSSTVVSENLSQPTNKLGDPSHIHRALDALAPHLRATPWLIHITDRGCGAYR